MSFCLFAVHDLIFGRSWLATGAWWGRTCAGALGAICSGFRVQGSGFRVQGSGCRVQGSGFRVQGSGFRVHGGAGGGALAPVRLAPSACVFGGGSNTRHSKPKAQEHVPTNAAQGPAHCSAPQGHHHPQPTPEPPNNSTLNDEPDRTRPQTRAPKQFPVTLIKVLL